MGIVHQVSADQSMHKTNIKIPRTPEIDRFVERAEKLGFVVEMTPLIPFDADGEVSVTLTATKDGRVYGHRYRHDSAKLMLSGLHRFLDMHEPQEGVLPHWGPRYGLL